MLREGCIFDLAHILQMGVRSVSPPAGHNFCFGIELLRGNDN